MTSLIPRLRQSPSDPNFVQSPYPTYDRLRAVGDLVLWEDYAFPVAAGYERVAGLLRDRRFGREVTHVRSREDLGWPEIPEHLKLFYDFESHSLLEREPPVHTRLRGLINRAFVSRAVERLRPRIEQLCHELIDTFGSSQPVDLLERYATPIPVIVIAELLGLPPQDAPKLLDWSHRMVAMYQFNRTREIEDAAVAATREFSAYIRDFINARRQLPTDDLMSTLIAARDQNDRLDEAELETTIILLMNAGHEATVHAISNGILAILNQRRTDPAAANALLASLPEPDYAAAVAEETLRFDPPLHLFTRYALEDIEIAGHQFRVGDKVGLLLGAANRDPRAFARPDDFNPARYLGDRPAPTPMSFGVGLHFCVGAPLARLELQVAFQTLFARLPHLQLAETPEFRDVYHFHGLDRVLTARCRIRSGASSASSRIRPLRRRRDSALLEYPRRYRRWHAERAPREGSPPQAHPPLRRFRGSSARSHRCPWPRIAVPASPAHISAPPHSGSGW